MFDKPIWSFVVGALFSAFGIRCLWHLVWPLRQPPRWGKSGHGPLLSRRSVLLVGTSTLLLGITSAASGFQIPWVTRSALPVLFFATFLAFWGALIMDALRR